MQVISSSACFRCGRSPPVHCSPSFTVGAFSLVSTCRAPSTRRLWLRTPQRALEAFGEVETALAAERHLAERETALAEAARQATLAEERALDRYARGLDDYITVRETQRSAFNAESQLLYVRRRRLETRIDLYLAFGGGYRRGGLSNEGLSGDDSSSNDGGSGGGGQDEAATETVDT